MIPIKPVPRNTDFSIRDNLDSDSNVTQESDLHSKKHFQSRISSDAGKVTHLKRLLQNVSFPISFNFDTISNAIDLMRVCREIHLEGMISIVEGIQSRLPEE
jgi:hypothetical protein